MNWKEDVLKRIKPSAEEENAVKARISIFLGKLNKGLRDAEAILGGSGAKGTWLKSQHDADIFVLFPYEEYKERSDKISDILEQRMKVFRFERLHGSRNYFRVQEGEFLFEIIPILHIKDARDARNITDVSPLHAAWVKKNTNEKLRDDIRLAKAFCRAQGCYGAESYIRGFSGYVLEMMVIYYRGFERLLKAAVNWEEKQIVDAGKLYRRKSDVWMAMNTAKLHSPLIVVDPVDKSRNAAAALSKEKWLLFKKKAAAFLKKPTAAFFEKKEASFEQLKKGKNHLVWLEIECNKGKDDKVGAQLLLAFEFLKKKIVDFGLVNSGWEWNKNAVFWFVVKKNKREKVELRQGPPLEMEKHVQAFKKKHKNTLVKKGIVFAKVAVDDYKLEDVVKHVIREEYFKEKVKKIKSMKII